MTGQACEQETGSVKLRLARKFAGHQLLIIRVDHDCDEYSSTLRIRQLDPSSVGTSLGSQQRHFPQCLENFPSGLRRNAELSQTRNVFDAGTPRESDHA